MLLKICNYGGNTCFCFFKLFQFGISFESISPSIQTFNVEAFTQVCACNPGALSGSTDLGF